MSDDTIRAEAWGRGYAAGQDSVYTSTSEWPNRVENPYLHDALERAARIAVRRGHGIDHSITYTAADIKQACYDIAAEIREEANRG